MSSILRPSSSSESHDVSPHAEPPMGGRGRSPRLLPLLVGGSLVALAIRRFRGSAGAEPAGDEPTDTASGEVATAGGRSRTRLALLAAAVAAIAAYTQVRRS